MAILAYLAAVAVGLAGLALAVWCIVVARALTRVRDAFQGFLADESPRGARELGAAAAERIRNPVLRRIVTHRIAAMAGTMVVQQIIDRLSDQIRTGWIVAAIGAGLVVFAVFVPGLLL
jgi:hypothetical protein